MYPVSDAWAPALTTSHGAVTRVDLMYGGETISEDIRIVSGAVTVDRGSEIRRSLRLTIPDPSVFPTLAEDPYSPYGHQLYVQRGIRYTDGTSEMVPLGHFVIESVSGNLRTGPLDIVAPGRESLAIAAPFEQATSTVGTATHAAFIAAQLLEVDPSFALVDNSTHGTDLLPTTTFNAGSSRWRALQDVALAVGAELFVGSAGSFTLADLPAGGDEFVWTVAAKENLILANASVSADGVANRVAVYGESAADNAVPVYGVAEITDPADPLRVNGPYGRRTVAYTSDLITSEAKAITMANALLPVVSSLSRTVHLDSVPNPALDAGDRIRVVYGGDHSPELHTVQRFVISLNVEDSFPIETMSGAAA